MIMTQPGNLKCKKILHVVGDSDPVKINKVVKDALQMCVKSSYTSVSFPAIGTGQGNAQGRLVADAMLDAVIDALRQNTSSPLTTIRIVIFQKAMLKDFHSSLEQRAATDRKPKDKRKGTLAGIASKFKVLNIERIQNPGLWKRLQIKKRDLELRNGHQNNERRLFHGTCNTTVPIINDRGFNRSHSGKNAAFYGDGTYFAVNASYSANDTYSKPNQNGEKFMYVCRVLTGDFTLGQQGMIEPPAKGTASTDLYDSVVDNLTNPTMFVVFHDDHAYPEYLITFK
uniref:poly [ADP-ribose] polymerase 15-like n=1 Tax=Maylandia zebra TaxID=106582 RepID=UPI000D2F8DAA|nr:poly [ADP-ribose] polymerase 15-like [Maylandia zebra]